MENNDHRPEDNSFEVIKEQIEIDIDSAQKYFENKLYHLSLRRYESALQFFEHLSPENFELLCETFYNVEMRRAVIFLHLENPHKVLEIIPRLRKLECQLIPVNEFDLDHLEGLALFMAGKFEKAIRTLNRVEEHFFQLLREDRSPGLLVKTGKSIKNNAHAHLYQLMIDRGMAKLYAARDLFLEANALGLVTDCDLLLGQLALMLQEQRTARFHISTAYSLADSLGLKSKKGLCLWLYARLEGLVGNNTRAQELYDRAKTLYLSHQFPKHAYLLLFDMIDFLFSQTRVGEIQDIFLEADDLIHSLEESFDAKTLLLLKQSEIQLLLHTINPEYKKKLRDLVRILRDRNNSYLLHTTILNLLLHHIEDGETTFAEELVQELDNFWISINSNLYPFGPFLHARITAQNNNPREAENHLMNAINELQDKAQEHFLGLYYLELAKLESTELNSMDLAHEYFNKSLDYFECDYFRFKFPFLKNLYFLFYNDPYQEYLEFIDHQGNPRLTIDVSERKLLNELRLSQGSDITQRLVPSGLSLALQTKWDEMITLSKKLLRFESSFEFCNTYDFVRKPLFYDVDNDFEISIEKDRFRREFHPDNIAERNLLFQRFNKIKQEVISEENRWRKIFDIPVDGLTQMNLIFDKKTAILLYQVGQSSSLAFVLIGGKLKQSFSINLTRKQLFEMIEQFRENVAFEKNTKIINAKLWNSLIDPMMPVLDDKVEKLVIIPHDILWKVPFHVLSKSNKYLWDKFLIEYAPSLTHYIDAWKKGEQRQRKRFHCFTLVVPGISEQLCDLANLEQTIKGRRSIDDLELITESLTSKKFWQRAMNTNILIVGTKLQLYERLPSASSFELGPSDLMVQESIITFDDILEKHFDETDIVIFPYVNCESAITYPLNAHALLYHTWLNSGVPTVLYSFWQSDPVAVFLFIKHFLGFKSKMGLSQALQKAAMTLRESGDFSSPRDWAPLSFIGYGGAISREARKRFFFQS